MERLKEIDIAGKKYRLNFSTKAAKVVMARYGSLEGFVCTLQQKSHMDAMEDLIFLLNLLLEQGAAYERIVEGTDATVPSVEELEILIGVPETEQRVGEILEALGIGMESTVETEDDPKNVETTQD